MGIFIVKVKIYMLSEDDMELEQEKDLAMHYKSGKWVWRRMGIIANDITRIIAFSSNKTMLIDSYDNKLLVSEPFDIVYKKWTENYEEDLILGPEELSLNQNDENNSEEEDD